MTEHILTPTFDSFIEAITPDTVQASNSNPIQVGDDSAVTNNCRRALMLVDVSSLTDPVTAAVLKLMARASDSGQPETGYDLEIWRLLAPFTQGEVTWNSRATGVPWATPGTGESTDRAAAYTVKSLVDGDTYHEVFFDVSADIEAWRTGTPNCGWLFKLPTAYEFPGVSQYRRVIFLSVDDGTPSNRPSLTVTTTPEVLGGSMFGNINALGRRLVT